VTPTTPASAARLHFIHDRREIVAVQRATRGGKDHRLFHVDMCAVCIFERRGDPPYLGQVSRREGALEAFVERDVSTVLHAELIEDRRDLDVRGEAREEGLLFVGFVTLHLSREEVGYVARGRLVETIAARGIGEGSKGLFEPPMRSRQLLERIGHFFPTPICWRIGKASFTQRWNDGRSITRDA
jgi:hypothetical protein